MSDTPETGPDNSTDEEFENDPENGTDDEAEAQAEEPEPADEEESETGEEEEAAPTEEEDEGESGSEDEADSGEEEPAEDGETEPGGEEEAEPEEEEEEEEEAEPTEEESESGEETEPGEEEPDDAEETEPAEEEEETGQVAGAQPGLAESDENEPQPDGDPADTEQILLASAKDADSEMGSGDVGDTEHPCPVALESPAPVPGLPSPPPPPVPGNLVVRVEDASDSSAIVATVQASGPQNLGPAPTDPANGKPEVKFNGVKTTPPDYTVTATKPGFTTETKTATVTAAKTTNVTIQLQKITLEIVDSANVLLTGTQNKIVGQKVRLRVRTKPLGQAMSNIQWTIPGERIKNYTQSTSSGVKTDLAPSDLTNASIDFYWINGGTQTVTVSATVAGAVLTASVDFNVLRPKMDSFKTKVSTVNLCVNNYLQPGTWLAAFQPTPAPAKVGNQWDAKVTAPAGGAGLIAFTQRINVNRVYTPNTGANRTFSSGGAFVLDDGLGIQYAGTQAIAAGASATRSTNDSPASQLNAGTQRVTDADSFELYLMYKSDEADSIWVTLGLVRWNWAGQTTRIGAPGGTANNWNPPTGTALASDPNGADSTLLPIWTAAFSSLSFV